MLIDQGGREVYAVVDQVGLNIESRVQDGKIRKPPRN